MSVGVMIKEEPIEFSCKCEYRGVTKQENTFNVTKESIVHETINRTIAYNIDYKENMSFYLNDESVNFIDFSETTVMYYNSGRVLDFRKCAIIIK